MRILLVSHAFLPHSKGGVEVCTANVALGLQDQGHEVHVFHRVAQKEEPEYEVRSGSWEGLPVTTINNTFARVSTFEETYRNRSVERAFATFVRGLEPDLVHFEHLTCLSTGLVELTRDAGIPTVLTLHDYWLVCQRGQMLQPDLTLCDQPEENACARCMTPHILGHPPEAIRRSGDRKQRLPRALDQLRLGIIRRYPGTATRRDLHVALAAIRERNRHVSHVLRQADVLLTPSASHRSQFVRFGVGPDRIQVQYNSLRTEPFDGFIHEPAGHVRFVFLGSVIPSKGVHLLVEAFNGLAGEQATLDIHGWAPPYEGHANYLRDLQATAAPRVTFHGAYENSQVASILAGADVVVIPSIWRESASMIAHEAFLARLPVIAARLGALAEFVQHEVNGLHFEPRDPGDLRRQMQRLIDDVELRAKLAANAGSVRTVAQQAIELHEAYRALVKGAGNPRAVYGGRNARP